MAKRFASILLGFSLIAAESQACIPYYPQYPSDSQEMVEVKIGDTYFRFPESFFYFAEDRQPTERDYVRIRVSNPDFKALPLDQNIRAMEQSEWLKAHPLMIVNIRENDIYVRGYSNSTPGYALTPTTQIQFWENKTLTPEGIKEKLKSFMFSKPSAQWAANQKLAEALQMEKDHSKNDPCAAFSRSISDKAPTVSPPPTPPVVAMEWINKGLAHKNEAIRNMAVFRLAAHTEDSADVIAKLKQIAASDKSYVVRKTALERLEKYEAFTPKAPFFVERLRAETNSIIIGDLGDLLRRSKENVALLLMDKALQNKEPRLSEEMDIIGWSINHEVQEKKLTKYEELSPQSKRALDLMMDYYERPDANQDRKDRIRNALRNSKSAIASPRYVDEMIKQGAISELGDMAVEPEKTIPVLIDELKSNRVANYPAAAEALGEFGPKAAPALPYLLPILKFDCPKEIGPNGEHIVRMGGFDDFKDPTKCRDSSVGYTRQVTGNAIAQIGVASPEVLAALYKQLGNKEAVYSAGSALVKLEPNKDKLMKQMLHHLKTSSHWEVRAWIARLLGEQGSSSASAVPTLRELMQTDPEKGIRFGARDAIEKITGEKLPDPAEPARRVPQQTQSPDTVAAPPIFTPPAVLPPVPAPQMSQKPTEIEKPAKPQIGPNGALDTSVASHDAYEKKWEAKTNRKSGEFAIYGAWDSGSCRGDDTWVCGSISGHQTGCEEKFPACASGIAVAKESYAGDGECVFTWWKWVCK